MIASTTGTDEIPQTANEAPPTRPTTRADCRGGLRPCPYACRYNLLYEADATGAISLRRTDGRVTVHRSASDHEFEAEAEAAIDEWIADPPTHSCALDVVEENPDGLPFESIADLIGLTRQRVEQIARATELKLGKGKSALDELEVANG